MLKQLLAAGFVCLISVQALSQTREEIRQAQTALAATGRDPGPIDGLMGQRTEVALRDFLTARGMTFDGQLSQNELDLLMAVRINAGPPSKLSNPGSIMDMAALTQNACFGRFPGAPLTAPLPVPPVAFDQANSIGNDPQNALVRSYRLDLSAAAAAAVAIDDPAAIERARQLLLTWADAGAGLGTANDDRYLGAGSGDEYRPEERAPILDMGRAILVAWSAASAHSMMRDHLSDSESDRITSWYQALFAQNERTFRPTTTGAGIWSDYPVHAYMAALNGNDEAFRSYMETALTHMRDRIQIDGAILKNIQRGDRALQYQGLGLQAITSLFYLMEYQGGSIPVDLEERLTAAVALFLDGDEDISAILPYAKEGYNNPGDGTQQERFYRFSVEHVWWMLWFMDRYPDTQEAARIAQYLDRHRTFDVRLLILPTPDIPVPLNCLVNPSLIASPGETFSAVSAQLEVGYSEQSFTRFELSLFNNSLGEKPIPPLQFDIFVDYAQTDNDPSSTEFVRLFFPRRSLQDIQSQQVDYRPCGDVLVKEEGGDQQLAIALFGDTSKNSCILDLMGQNDRALFRSLEWSTRDVIGQASGGGAESLRATFRIPEPEILESDGLQASLASIYPRSTEDRWRVFQLNLQGIELAGVDTPNFSSWTLLADYDGQAKTPADMNFLRLWFYRDTLLDPSSREANFLDCPNIVARDSGGRQEMAIALLGDTRGNGCILGKMGPNDQAFYSAMLRDLPRILSQQATTDASQHINGALTP